MPAPATNEELFALIAKSGVLDDARVKQYVGNLMLAGGLPSDPIKLGGLMVRDGLLTHFQAEQLLQGRWKRFNIGKYKVLERLGVGGMGQVFLCEHKLMKRKVAVKVLPAAKAKDEAALQRFYREARAVAAVDHPNIVRAYDIDDDDDLHFLVMEYVDGSNLYDMVRKTGPMPPLRACHYVYGAAVGLQHAHEMGLIHRDIKPANILVDRAGVVKILDMGLARFFNPDDDDHLTKKFDENVLGTADYLAPEQALDSTAVDIRADIYGLGGTFYFMLTGHPPFPEGTVAQKLLWHQSKPPKPIAAYRKDVPAQLVAVVDRMLAKEPSARFQTPAEVMDALVGWVQTPIPPPTEAELPQMSVAAGGKPASGSGAPNVTAPPPATGPRTPGTVPVSRARPAPTRPPVAVAAPPGGGSSAPPAAPNVWAELQNSETIPTAEDTARTRKERDRPPAKRSNRTTGGDDPAAERKKSRLLWILLAVAGGVLLLGGAAAVSVVVFGPKPAASPPVTESKQGERKIWYVAKSGDGPNAATTRKTLGEVTAKIGSGDEIVLLDDTVELPQLLLRDLKDVRISAGVGRTATLLYKPPTGLMQPPAAVVHLRGCENVTLGGVVIDAGGLHDVGLQVSGQANGVVLDRVTVKNARKQGVNLLNVAADPATPLTLTNCRLVLPAGADAGVNLAGSREVDCRGVRILDSRFEGVGSGSGVRVEGATDDVEVKNNRLFNLDAGVLLAAGADAPKKCRVTVERNTFHTAKTGVRVDQLPAADRDLSVSRNYFAAAGVAVTAADPKGVKATQNGLDAATQPGVSAGEVVPDVALPAPTPDAPDAQFLKAKITLGGKPVGAD